VKAVVVEADGGARGNPGPAGYGAVVRDADSGEVLVERLGALGVTTNNVAEYTGLIAGLRAATELGATEVEVRMDSKLVIEQMSGRWQIKHPGLRPLAAEAATLVQRFSAVRFTWVPREQNRHADALANAAMDGESSVEVPAPTSWEPPETGTGLRMLLVRHGATTMTAERRYSGRRDVPLSSIGEAQASAVAGRIASFGVPLAAVVTSPLSRCTQTARIIAGSCGNPPVSVDDDLVECDFGAWDGLTFAEVRSRFPAELTRWLGSAAVAPPGGESFQAVAKRVRRSVGRLREAYPEGTIVVVSHVTPLKLMLRDALAAGDAFLHRCYLDAAGLSIVDSWADGGVAVRAVNETAHLGPATS
jgi:ribonuclease H / adenosylcobalamin/alpha-ribazole phosphatase